jgi:hypothetical protein
MALSKGVRQIVLAHLVNSGIQVSNKDFEIVFVQSLVDLSGLEKLEFDDAKQAIVGNAVDFITKIMQQPLLGQAIDHKVLLEWLQEKFSILADGAVFFKTDKETMMRIMDQAELMAQVQNASSLDAINPDGESDTGGEDSGPKTPPKSKPKDK